MKTNTKKLCSVLLALALALTALPPFTAITVLLPKALQTNTSIPLLPCKNWSTMLPVFP